MRQFSEGPEKVKEVFFDGEMIPFGPQLLYVAKEMEGLVVSAEVCEDVWSPVSPGIEKQRWRARYLL